MTRRDDAVSLRHMLDHARKAVGYAAGRDRPDLDTDELLALSLVRLLEIVGEAAARVSSETRQRHDSLPWTDIVAMRNRLLAREPLRPLFVRLLGDPRLPAADRARAGEALAGLGDPRTEITTVNGMEFRPVPAGPFRMGSDERNEEPAHDCEIPYSYQMARYPVTVAQFREFVESAGFRPRYPGCISEAANNPVVVVSWGEALAFCEWLTARWRGSGRIGAEERVTLPSEAEWEKAARGTDGRKYPWGAEADPERANLDQSGIGGVSAVGCFPAGASPFRCEEMSGNVWEWTRSKWGKDWREPAYLYPYVPGDDRDRIDPADDAKVIRVLRGGSYNEAYQGGRCARREWLTPDLCAAIIGFRVVLLPFSSGL